jgi:hypothetical protein
MDKLGDIPRVEINKAELLKSFINTPWSEVKSQKEDAKKRRIARGRIDEHLNLEQTMKNDRKNRRARGSGFSPKPNSGLPKGLVGTAGSWNADTVIR